MLDPEKAKEYNDRLRESKEETEKLADATERLADGQRDVLYFSRDFATEARNAAKATGMNSIQASETAKSFKKVAEAAKTISDNYEEVLSGEKKLGDLAKGFNQMAEARNSLQTEYGQFLLSNLGDVEAVNQVLEGTLGLEEALFGAAEKGFISEDQMVAAERMGDIFRGQFAELENQEALFGEIEKRANNIADATSVFGKGAIGLADVAEGFDGMMKKAGLGNIAEKMNIKGAIADTNKMASAITKGGTQAAGMGGKFKLAGNLVKGLGSNLLKSLSPATLLVKAGQMLVEAFQAVDKMSGEIAKQFGVSAEEGQKMVAAATDAANASGDMLVSTKDVVKAQQKLNEEFGTAVQFSGELAAEYASVAERTGLSDKAMGHFAASAQILGTSIKDQLRDVQAVTLELNSQNGTAISAKEIQEGIAKASSAQLLMAGRNTKELANQVYQAKMLGVEQSKVEGIADNLLNFEQSIQDELTAELMIGRDLNLERARAAALEGDLATVAKEVKEQVGSAAEFGEMNVAQQDALAKAVGMTRQELADALVEQEKMAAIQSAFGKDIKSMSEAQAEYNRLRAEGMSAEEAAKKIGDEALAAQMESTSQADKMAAIQEKIMDLFMQIANALMPIFNVLMEVFELVLMPIFDLLSAAIKPILEAIMAPVRALFGAFEEIRKSLSGIFGEAEGGASIFSTIGEIIGTVISIPLGIVQFTIEMITERLKGLSEIFGGLGKIIGGDFMGGIKDIGKGIVRIVIAPFQAIMDVGTSVINGLISAANLIPGVNISKISSFNVADAIFGEEEEEEEEEESSDEPSTPLVALAEGGIVTKPTPAIVGEGGEPEAVTPLSKLGSFLSDSFMNYTPLGMAVKGVSNMAESSGVADSVSSAVSGLAGKFTSLTGIGGQSNDEKMIALLERLVNAVEQGKIIELDGNKVGTALGMSSYKTQ